MADCPFATPENNRQLVASPVVQNDAGAIFVNITFSSLKRIEFIQTLVRAAVSNAFGKALFVEQAFTPRMRLFVEIRGSNGIFGL